MADTKKLKGVFCYEATPNGDLKLYVCPPDDDKTGDPVEVTIEHNDLPRLHATIANAMMGKESKR